MFTIGGGVQADVPTFDSELKQKCCGVGGKPAETVE
jgi:hypothetical protein